MHTHRILLLSVSTNKHSYWYEPQLLHLIQRSTQLGINEFHWCLSCLHIGRETRSCTIKCHWTPGSPTNSLIPPPQPSLLTCQLDSTTCLSCHDQKASWLDTQEPLWWMWLERWFRDWSFQRPLAMGGLRKSNWFAGKNEKTPTEASHQSTLSASHTVLWSTQSELEWKPLL